MGTVYFHVPTRRLLASNEGMMGEERERMLLGVVNVRKTFFFLFFLFRFGKSKRTNHTKTEKFQLGRTMGNSGSSGRTEAIALKKQMADLQKAKQSGNHGRIVGMVCLFDN